jgi:hypothetical protein
MKIDEVIWGNANGAGKENRNVGRRPSPSRVTRWVFPARRSTSCASAALIGVGFTVAGYKIEDLVGRLWDRRSELANPAVSGMSIGLIVCDDGPRWTALRRRTVDFHRSGPRHCVRGALLFQLFHCLCDCAYRLSESWQC